jgi:hypothetical protein
MTAGTACFGAAPSLADPACFSTSSALSAALMSSISSYRGRPAHEE